MFGPLWLQRSASICLDSLCPCWWASALTNSACLLPSGLVFVIPNLVPDKQRNCHHSVQSSRRSFRAVPAEQPGNSALLINPSLFYVFSAQGANERRSRTWPCKLAPWQTHLSPPFSLSLWFSVFTDLDTPVLTVHQTISDVRGNYYQEKTVFLRCTVNSNPPARFIWKRGNMLIEQSKDIGVDIYEPLYTQVHTDTYAAPTRCHFTLLILEEMPDKNLFAKFYPYLTLPLAFSTKKPQTNKKKTQMGPCPNVTMNSLKALRDQKYTLTPNLVFVVWYLFYANINITFSQLLCILLLLVEPEMI